MKAKSSSGVDDVAFCYAYVRQLCCSFAPTVSIFCDILSSLSSSNVRGGTFRLILFPILCLYDWYLELNAVVSSARYDSSMHFALRVYPTYFAACALQDCISAHTYTPEKCQDRMRKLYECCAKLHTETDGQAESTACPMPSAVQRWLKAHPASS
jgi:hypothetical protein